MAKWGMVIEISKCVLCYSCFVACKDEYWENDYPPYTAAQPRHGQFWMNLKKNERGKYPWVRLGHMPYPCMQCDDASCIEAARGGAVYKRDDGIVVIDPKKAKGQRQLLEPSACPYGVIFWNEETKLPQKCTFCVHRVEEGKTPRCVQICPTEAIKFGDLDDPSSEVAKLLKSGKAEVYLPERKTSPRVYYTDLYKMTKHFIAGAVVYDDVNECAEGVTVTLSGARSAKTKTNNYGNFEFDGLDAGRYTVKVAGKGYAARAIDVDLKKDNYLGDIFLVRD